MRPWLTWDTAIGRVPLRCSCHLPVQDIAKQHAYRWCCISKARACS